jgi:RNA polymerase sigma-70 factor (ECF subfamily)
MRAFLENTQDTGSHTKTFIPDVYRPDVGERPAGHRALVRRLYEVHGASLYRYAVMLLSDAAAAEDVVQQVFARLLRQSSPIVNEAHYLRRATRNECYSHLRSLKAARGSDAPLLETAAPTATSAEERIALERAIRELPIEQREVIHLHVFEGWTFQQIAEASSESINTVAARYRYAISRMRRILTPDV